MKFGDFDVVAVIRRVAQIEPAAAPFEDLHWGVAAIDRAQCWLDARRAEFVNECNVPRPQPDPGDGADPQDPTASDSDAGQSSDGHGSADGQEADEPKPDLGEPTRLTAREQEVLARRADLLGAAALFAAALAANEIRTAHVDVFAAVLRGVRASIRERVLLREDELLGVAKIASPGSLARAVRREIDRAAREEGVDLATQQRSKCRVRQYAGDDGMHHIHATLDAELAEILAAALQAEVEALFHSGEAKGLDQEQMAAIALVNLVSSGRVAPRKSDPDRAQFVVLADFETLFGGMHDRSILETAGGRSIHLETARRLWCDAEVTWAILIEGKVATLISEDELATRQQRRALRAMYRTCVHPECEVPFDRCHIHHVAFRRHGGKTVMENLVPVCYRHHHLIHEGGWRLSMDADRSLRWRQPDGTTTSCGHVPLRDLDRVPGAGSRSSPPGGPGPGAPPGRDPAAAAAAQMYDELRLFADDVTAA